MLINKEITKERQWSVKTVDGDAAFAKIKRIAAELGINEIVAKLLYIRGYCDSKDAERFLRMKNEMLCDPFTMRDMSLAVARVKKAVDNGERITVYEITTLTV